MTKKIPVSSMDRIIHEIGAERVSSEAAERLREIVEGIAMKIAIMAWEAAKHAGRKTVKKEDIDFALREITEIPIGSLVSKVRE
ncbi:MAG TPA: histone [Thermoprotei archaeon]|nr:histone [Thermoprotei archaeon]